MAITLSIGDIPICGAVGDSLAIAVDECWLRYCRCLAKGNAPMCAVRRYAQWSVNGRVIDTPKAYFLVLQDE